MNAADYCAYMELVRSEVEKDDRYRALGRPRLSEPMRALAKALLARHDRPRKGGRRP